MLDSEEMVKILDAAEVLILDLGFTKVTMALIGERAGVSRRTLYRRFPSKDILMAALIASRASSAESRVTEAISKSDVEDVLLTGFVAGTLVPREEPIFFELMYGSGAAWYQKQMCDFDSPVYQQVLSINLKFWSKVLDQAKNGDVINKQLDNEDVIRWYMNIQYLSIIQKTLDVDELTRLMKMFFVAALKYQPVD